MGVKLIAPYIQQHYPQTENLLHLFILTQLKVGFHILVLMRLRHRKQLQRLILLLQVAAEVVEVPAAAAVVVVR
jgi:hypothetical protein